MSLFVWDDYYSVHHAGIDDQHKELFRLANSLYEAMLRGDRTVLGETLPALVKYAGTHLGDEEALMLASGFPHYTAHRAEHFIFNQRVGALMDQWDRGNKSLALETMVLLRDWLEEHIKEQDALLGEHLSFGRRGIGGTLR